MIRTLLLLINILLVISNGDAQVFNLGEKGHQYRVEIYLDTHVEIECGSNAIHVEELPGSVASEVTSMTIKDCELPTESLQEVVQILGTRYTGSDIRLNGVPLIRRQDVAFKTVKNIYVWKSGVASDAFEMQSKLKEIVLYTANVNLTETFFSGLTKLEKLFLNDCHIHHLPKNIFIETPQLRIMNLVTNLITEVTKSDFQGLASLEELDLSANLLTSLPDDLLHFLPSLKELHVDKNSLNELSAGALNGTHIAELSIKDNTVPLNLAPRALADMSRLTIVVLSNSSIISLPADLLEGSNAVEKIDLSRNHIEYIPTGFFGGKSSLQGLNLNNNRLRVLSTEAFVHLVNLRLLQLDHNTITVITKGTFSTMTKLGNLTIRSNGLREVSPDALPGSLRYLYLENNKLVTLETTVMPALQLLYLNNNSFSSLPSLWRNTFPTLGNIELKDNAFTTLTKSDFAAIPNCTELDLTNNRIVTIQVGKQTKLPTWLYLGRSPLRCDCHLYAFASLFQENWSEMYAYCAEPPVLEGKKLVNVSFEDFLCHVESCPKTCACVVRPATNALEVECRERLTAEQIVELELFRQQHYSDITLNTTISYHQH